MLDIIQDAREKNLKWFLGKVKRCFIKLIFELYILVVKSHSKQIKKNSMVMLQYSKNRKEKYSALEAKIFMSIWL